MTDQSKLHDEKYKKAKSNGLPGWGSLERVSQLSQIIEDRYFGYSKAPTSGQLLELGCGAGNLSIALAKKGFTVIGMDFAESAISWARENAFSEGIEIDFRVGDVTHLSVFENETFDVVYDGNCLHCIIGENRKLAFSEWRRVLKMDGTLFISSLCAPKEGTSFPKDFDATSRILLESNVPYRFIPTEEFIEDELKAAGFEIAHRFVRCDAPFGHINIHAKKISPADLIIVAHD